MRSPFPGMDPWLEFHWRDVHARLIIYIADQLQRHLPAPLVARAARRPRRSSPAPLVARAEETVSVDIEEDKPVMVRPDMAVSEDWRGAGDNGGVATAVEPTTVADPLVLYAPEIEFDRHVEIYDPTGGGRVVTAIEVLSPSNKLPGRARKAYESKQRLFLSGGGNLVEIDLVREGEWVFSIDESVMPARKRTPCMICVFRATRPGERAAYPLRVARAAAPHRDSAATDRPRRGARSPDRGGRSLREGPLRPHRLPPPARPAPSRRRRRVGNEVLQKAGRL